jgi:regulator of protease activity HflC (stomatin/prohibitin superfamily)
MMRSKLVLGLLLPLVLVFNVGCATRIGPGHIGLQVALAGSNRGVQDTTIRTGYVFYNPFTTTVMEYPTYVQTAKWTGSKEGNPEQNEEMTFKSKEGVLIKADVSISYQLTADKAPHFYVKYLTDDLNGFTHGVLRNITRDAFNETAAQYSVDDIIGGKMSEFLTAVKDKVNNQVESEGITLQQFGFLETPTLPESYQQAMLAKQTAVQSAQQKENELRATNAEAAKQVAQAEGQAKARLIAAEAEAESNRKIAGSLSPTILELKRLEVQNNAIGKWSGNVPQITGGGQGNGGSLNIVVPLQPR